ncbi:hypothetical protein Zm00014a_038872 [Zea mays]|uniref:Uncharacterized protein n=1 Tax=Zea mays TaxID=4577 RepID=A0A3L6FC04_MAIZE|nr:hypothetical protein Zm00014a_038872 [Zea mays]
MDTLHLTVFTSAAAVGWWSRVATSQISRLQCSFPPMDRRRLMVFVPTLVACGAEASIRTYDQERTTPSSSPAVRPSSLMWDLAESAAPTLLCQVMELDMQASSNYALLGLNWIMVLHWWLARSVKPTNAEASL